MMTIVVYIPLFFKCVVFFSFYSQLHNFPVAMCCLLDSNSVVLRSFTSSVEMCVIRSDHNGGCILIVVVLQRILQLDTPYTSTDNVNV